MKIIVIFNSKTGFTKKYVLWIAEKTKADFVKFGERLVNSEFYGGFMI